jgi:hypothetical protein
MSVFGEAKFGGKRTFSKLKDGDVTFRILPPMGYLKKDGRWSQYCSIHYGYKNSANQMRTFESPLVKNKEKMVVVQDAALERIEALLAKLEEAKKTKNKDLETQLLKLVGGQKSRYNLDKNHYMNVVDLQGNISILKIRHKAKLALDAAIKKLRDQGVQGGGLAPDNGRFFTFSRSGSGRDTIYQVTVYEKTITLPDVGEVKQAVVHTIDEALAARCCTVKGYDTAGDPIYEYREAANLANLFKKPTAEEVLRIVKEGETAVDEILDSKSTTDDGGGNDDAGSEDDDETTTTTTAAPVTVTATPPPTTTVPKTETKTTTSATAPKTTAETVTNMSDEDFLKTLGVA